MATKTHKELSHRPGDPGYKFWWVITVRDLDGAYLHFERFSTKAEAANWLRWS